MSIPLPCFSCSDRPHIAGALVQKKIDTQSFCRTKGLGDDVEIKRVTTRNRSRRIQFRGRMKASGSATASGLAWGCGSKRVALAVYDAWYAPPVPSDTAQLYYSCTACEETEHAWLWGAGENQENKNSAGDHAEKNCDENALQEGARACELKEIFDGLEAVIAGKEKKRERPVRAGADSVFLQDWLAPHSTPRPYKRRSLPAVPRQAGESARKESAPDETRACTQLARDTLPGFLLPVDFGM